MTKSDELMDGWIDRHTDGRMEKTKTIICTYLGSSCLKKN